MTRVERMLVAAAFAVLMPLAAQAAPIPAISISGGTQHNDSSWTLGWNLTVNSTITVTHLGAYDVDGDGFNRSHEVGIWTAGLPGTLLASTTVSSADTLIDGFRYHAITPLVLTPTVYKVGAADYGAAETYLDHVLHTTPPAVTYDNSAFVNGSGLLFPLSASADDGYFGGSFLFVVGVLPEPVSLAVFGGGLLALGLLRRRRAA